MLAVLALGCSGCAAFVDHSNGSTGAGSVRVPLDAGLNANGGPLYVTDAAMAAALPALAGVGDRYSTCASGMTFPPQLYLAYGPAVTKRHATYVTYVHCAFDDSDGERLRRGEVTCDQPKTQQAFFNFENPAQFFTTQGAPDAGEAQRIAAAFFGGKLEDASGAGHIDFGVVHAITLDASGGKLRVRWGDCGCTETLTLERQGSGDGARYRVAGHDSICI